MDVLFAVTAMSLCFTLILLIVNPKRKMKSRRKLFWNKGFDIKPWDKTKPLYEEFGGENFAVRSSSSSHFKVYVRRNDIISDMVRSSGNWYDCIALVRYWDNLPGKGPNDYFLDIGANIGICSMDLLDKGVKTISIEPLPGNLNLYTKSLLANPQFLNNVILFPYGVGDSEKTSMMKVLPGNWGGASLLKDLKGFVQYPIKISTLDKILAKIKTKIHLACLDVEGYELDVLKGATETLKRKLIRHIYMELRCEYIAMVNRREDDFYNFFEKYGYHMYKRYCKSRTDEFNVLISEK